MRRTIGKGALNLCRDGFQRPEIARVMVCHAHARPHQLGARGCAGNFAPGNQCADLERSIVEGGFLRTIQGPPYRLRFPLERSLAVRGAIPHCAPDRGATGLLWAL